MNIHAFWKDVLAQNREKLWIYFHEDAPAWRKTRNIGRPIR